MKTDYIGFAVICLFILLRLPFPSCAEELHTAKQWNDLNIPHLGHFPFVWSGWSDQSVLKWNTQVLRTGSGQNGPAHGSKLVSSPILVSQSTGIWRNVVWKNVCTALDIYI